MLHRDPCQKQDSGEQKLCCSQSAYDCAGTTPHIWENEVSTKMKRMLHTAICASPFCVALRTRLSSGALPTARDLAYHVARCRIEVSMNKQQEDLHFQLAPF